MLFDPCIVSKLVINIQYYLTQVLIHVSALCIESGCDVFKRLEEAVQVHLGVFAPAYHVLVDDVIVCFGNVIVGHIRELSQSLELARGDKVVVLLSSEELENSLGL